MCYTFNRYRHRFKAAITNKKSCITHITTMESSVMKEKKMVEKFANEYITGYLKHFSSSSFFTLNQVVGLREEAKGK
mgnify:FL=1